MKSSVIVVLTILSTLVGACAKVEDSLKLINPVVGDVDAPRVLASDPFPGQTNVSRSQVIRLTFSKDVDTQKCIRAFQIQPPVRGLFQALGAFMEFTPSAPLDNGTYVISIGRDCEDANGRDLQESYQASFAVGLSTGGGGASNAFPTVPSITVPIGTAVACAAGTGVATDLLTNAVTNACTGNPGVSPLVVTFSEPMVRATAENAFLIVPSVTGAFSWNAGSTVMTFTPDITLDFGQRYDVRIQTNALDSQSQSVEFPVLATFVVGALDSTRPTVQDITLERTAAVSGDACVAPANDLVLAATGSSTTEVCVGIPVIINFSEAMNQSDTASAVLFSPSLSSSAFWATTTQLVITPLGSGFASNTTYSMTILSSAKDLAGNTLQTDFGITFTTENAAPQVVGVGLQSHGATCDQYNPPAEPLGGNAGFGAGNCWWDSSQALLSPSNYLFQGGNGGCNVDATTDNFRLIFNRYMDPVVTLNAVTVRRLSSISIVKIASFSWGDCQGVAPFGCRALTLVVGEDLSACGGGVGTLDIGDTSAGPPGYPIYTIEVDTTARDVNGTRLSNTFFFAMEGN